MSPITKKNFKTEIKKMTSFRKECKAKFKKLVLSGKRGWDPVIIKEKDMERARHLHLAYGLLKGISYAKMEPKCSVPPSSGLIANLIKEFSDGSEVEWTPEMIVDTWMLVDNK